MDEEYQVDTNPKNGKTDKFNDFSNEFLQLELHPYLPFLDGLDEFIQSLADIEPGIVRVLSCIVDDVLFGIFIGFQLDDCVQQLLLLFETLHS